MSTFTLTGHFRKYFRRVIKAVACIYLFVRSPALWFVIILSYQHAHFLCPVDKTQGTRPLSLSLSQLEPNPSKSVQLLKDNPILVFEGAVLHCVGLIVKEDECLAFPTDCFFFFYFIQHWKTPLLTVYNLCIYLGLFGMYIFPLFEYLYYLCTVAHTYVKHWHCNLQSFTFFWSNWCTTAKTFKSFSVWQNCQFSRNHRKFSSHLSSLCVVCARAWWKKS